MSTTIDQRVVEMRFDNKHFEQNVQTTMSTLDKLKQKLNLPGASKGLESINSAAKNNNVHMLGAAAEQVGVKFSAMQVAGVTAISRITNQAMAAGEKIIKALTIDPVKTGFDEYETQINAVQTILANTSHNGTTIDQVNDALLKLNEYADKTIYNFTEMTRNIGTFTAAGVDLDTSVSAIQGIANLAAVSGSTSQQASTAMYQLSQALAAGRVSLMDWNSVVNAGMGGKVFQDALIRTSNVMGTGADAAIKKYGSFRESLTKGEWLTTEVLTETLNQFTMAAKEGSDEWNKFKKSLKDKGYSEEQAEAILKMANTATSAATEVKTFTQLWDVLKESAQSGWSQTWKLLVGDFEEAKALLSPVADVLTGIINKMSDARNDVLASALGKSFTGLADKIKGITDPVKKSADGVKEVVDSVKDYAKVVDEIIGGKWGNGQARWDALAKAGYDWAHAQNLVNEKLGSSVRHTTKYKEAQNGVKESQEKTTESTAKLIQKLTEMSDAELKAAGYSESQIKALREIEKQADKTGLSVKDFVMNIDELDGKWLIVNSFKNIWSGLSTVVKSFGQAWREVFHGDASDEEILAKRADMVYNIIAAIHKFTTYLKTNGEASDKLVRSLKGLFAIVDIITTIFGGGFKIAFKIISQLLEAFDMNLLDVTANLGDAIVAFRDWFDSLFDCSGIVEVLVPILKNAADVIKYFVTSAKESDTLALMVKNIKSAAKAVGDWIKGLKDAENIPEYIANGLINGLKGIVKNFDSFAKLISDKISSIPNDIIAGLTGGLWDGASGIIKTLMNLGIKMIEAICSVLGIHSPSTVFFAIGGFIIAGLIYGLKNGFPELLNLLENSGSTIIDIFKNIDFGQVFAAIISTGFMASIYKIANAFSALAAPAEGLGDLLSGAGEVLENSAKGVKKVLKSFSKVLNSFAMGIKAKALKDVAIAIAILVGALAVITLLDQEKLLTGLGVLTALAIGLGALFVVIDKVCGSGQSIGDNIKDAINVSSISAFLIAVSVSLLILVGVLKIVETLNPEKAKDTIFWLGIMIGSFAAVFAAFGTLVKGKSAQNIGKAGGMMLKMSFALLLMVGVVKLIGLLDWKEMAKGGAFIAGFALFVLALTGISLLGGKKIDSLGGMMLKLSVALVLMVGVVKLVSQLEWSEMGKAVAFVAGFTVFVWALTAITRQGKDTEIAKVGGLLLSISAAMLILVGVAKLIATMEWGEMGKAAIGIGFLTLIISSLIKTIGKLENNAPKIAGSILAISAAIGILAAISIILSFMDIGALAKGLTAVGILSAMIGLLVLATKDANDVKGNLIAMSIAIGVMTASIVVLSMIDGGELAGATIALGALMGIFSLMIKATQNAQKCLGNLIVMTVAIGILAGALYLLSDVESSNLVGASVAISMLIGMMALLAKSSNNTMSAIPSIIVMGLVVAGLAHVLKTIGELPIVSTIVAVGSLTNLLTTMSIVLKIMKHSTPVGASAIVAMVVMVGVMELLGLVLYHIGTLKIQDALLNTIALSTLLISMSVAMAILSKFGGNVVGLGAGVVAMYLMVGVMELLGLVLYHVGTMNIQNGMESVAMLSTLLIAMSVAVGILGLVGTLGPAAFIGIGALSTMIIALGAIVAGIGALATKFPELEDFVNTGMPLLEKIGSAIGSLLGNMVGEFLGGLTAGLPEIGTNLSDFMSELQGFVDGARGIDESAVIGVKNLAAMIIAIAKANIMDSIGSFLTGDKSMATFGAQIKQFGEAMVGFSQTISGNIDESAITAAASAGKMIAEMQSNIQGVGGLMEFFAGEKNLGAFGSQIQQFGEAIVGFSNTIVEGGGIDESAVTAAASAGKVMSEMQASLPGTGGVLQWFLGEKDFLGFSSQLVAFGGAIVAFSDKVKGKINEEAVTAAANAGELMITMQKKIPSSGGVVQFFTGEHNFTNFSTQLVAFGNAIVAFSKKVSEEGAINETAIEAAAKAGTLMAELNTKVVPSGKVIDFFTGKKDLATFGKHIVEYGKAIVDFSKAVSAESGLDVTAIQNAVDAGAKLTEVQKAIPTDKWLDGKMSIDSFGKKIKKYGEHMADFSDEVSDIDNSAVSKSVTAAENLVSIAKSVVTIDVDKIGNFKKVKTIGETLSGYHDKIADVDSGAISKSITNARKLVSLVNSMAGLDSSGINTFKTAMKSLGTVSVNDFVESFNRAIPKLTSVGGKMTDSLVKGMQSKRGVLTTTSKNMADIMIKTVASRNGQFSKAAVTLMNGFVKGIASGKSKIKSSLTSALSSGVTAVRGYHTNFYNAGSYLCSGLASGINSNSYKAVNAAKAMAKAVKNAAKEALKINSPSKVFVEIGSGIIEGFVKGIDDNMGYTTSAVTDMADTAKNGFGNAISSITGLLDGSMEMQPTIRPVLDLSNVKSGAASINGMLSNQSVGISSNISAISNMMNQRNQNGTNNDIVSAVDRLYRKLDNVGGNTSYNINGITYDDGSNVADAIKAIVRYANIERRV